VEAVRVKVKVCGITISTMRGRPSTSGRRARGLILRAQPALRVARRRRRDHCAAVGFGLYVGSLLMRHVSTLHRWRPSWAAGGTISTARAAELCRDWTPKVIKAIASATRTVMQARAYDVDFILADAYVEGQLGGTGTRVALELLEGFDRQRLILAGGLTADNVAAAVRAVRPRAIDVASGVKPRRKEG